MLPQEKYDESEDQTKADREGKRDNRHVFLSGFKNIGTAVQFWFSPGLKEANGPRLAFAFSGKWSEIVDEFCPFSLPESPWDAIYDRAASQFSRSCPGTHPLAR